MPEASNRTTGVIWNNNKNQGDFIYFFNTPTVPPLKAANRPELHMLRNINIHPQFFISETYQYGNQIAQLPVCAPLPLPNWGATLVTHPLADNPTCRL